MLNVFGHKNVKNPGCRSRYTLRISGQLLGEVIEHSVEPAAAKGQDAAGILSIQMLKQLVSLIRKFIQTERSNQTDHLVNPVTGAQTCRLLKRAPLCSTLVIIICHNTNHSNRSRQSPFIFCSNQTRGLRVRAAGTTAVITADQSSLASLLSRPSIMAHLHMYEKKSITLPMAYCL